MLHDSSTARHRKIRGSLRLDFHCEVLLFIFELGFETVLELGSFPLSDFFSPVHCFEVRK